MTKPVNILIVDDLADKLLALQTVLEELRQNVVAVRSGREALRQVMEKDFAVILLDVNMPDIDGFETAALIRQRRRSAHTPIIFITAFGDDMHTSRGYSLGAVDYILSPVVPEILRTKVSVFVELHRIREEVERHAEERVELARAQAARAAAEAATRHSQFLAEASKILGGSLSFDAILPGLARLATPFFGNIGAVILADKLADRCQAVVAWHDAATGAVHHRLTPRAWLHAALLDAAHQHLGPEGVPLAEDLPVWSVAADAEALPSLHTGHGLLLPLTASGRTLGVLLTARGSAAPPLAADECALARDLASRAAVALDNARLYHDIQEADQRKDDFLAMLAHELRNPLAPIRNAIHLLRLQKDLSAEQTWAHDLIERQVQHLVRLVDDLLDVSRITRGKIQLRKECVDLGAVVACAVETSAPFIEARQHQLAQALPRERVWVHADRTRLAQVLTNLINNAAKYTEPGGRIAVTVLREHDDAVVKVADTGIGIAPELLDHVFDMFFQVNRALDRSDGGLGIGLTMVQRLMQLHGGTVRAHSKGLQQGSEFVIRLPASAAPKPLSGSTAPDAAPHARERWRVLVVDDNRDAAESLALVLRQFHHDIRVAHDGPSALAIGADFQPQLALLDIGLPLMDGYELARQIRQQLWSAHTTVVAITGYGQSTDKARAREAGFEHHLVKPVAPDVLLGLIADLQAQRPASAGC